MDQRSTLQSLWSNGSALTRRRLLQFALAGSATAAAGTLNWTHAFAQDSTPEANPFGEPQTTGGTAIIATTTIGNPRIFIPTSYYGTDAFFVSKLVYTPLINLDRQWMNMGPALAESWHASEDGLTFTFSLRKDVVFHDGTPLTAQDVEFTYKLACRKDTSFAVRDVSLLQGGPEYKAGTSEELPGVQVVDDYTVQFNLTATSNVFLLNVSNCGILPKHKFADDALTSDTLITDLPFFNWDSEPPIGTGPWKITEYDPSTNLSFAAHEQYFRGRPVLDGLTMRIGLQGPAIVSGLQAGEFDSAYISYDDAKSLEGDDSLDLLINHDLANEQVFIFATEKPYLPVGVRQALMTGTDVNTIISTVTYDYGRPAPSVMMYPALLPNPDLPVYAYDPEKAKQMLADAGWDGSQTLKFGQFVAQGAPSATMAAIMSMWNDIGVQTEYVALDPAAQADISKSDDHPYDVVLTAFAWLAYDPSSAYSSFGSEFRPDYSNYSNPEFDKLMQEAIRIPNMEDAIATYQQAAVILQTDLPYAPGWITPEIWGVRKNLHGGVLGRGPLNDIQSEKWWKE